MSEVKKALLSEFAIIFNRFSEGEDQKSDRISDLSQELVNKISVLGVDFKHGPLHGKAVFGQKMPLIGIVIILKNQEDREKIVDFLSGLNSISLNEVLPELTEEGRRRVEGGGP